MGNFDYASLLYSQPSMQEGFARALDIGGVFDAYQESPTSAEADRLAMMSDWYAVGADLHHAVQRYSARVQQTESGDPNVRSR
jgi:hypothetical protein